MFRLLAEDLPLSRVLQYRLLRVEYWFDRLGETQRLLVGLTGLAFLGASCLYLLALGSSVLVNRMESDTLLSAEPPDATPQPSQPARSGPRSSSSSGPAAAATPAFDSGGDLINAPLVPELSVVAPPRFDLKPRVGGTEVALPVASPEAPSGPIASPGVFRPPAPNGSPAPVVPIPTVAPANGPTATRVPTARPQGVATTPPTTRAATPTSTIRPTPTPR